MQASRPLRRTYCPDFSNRFRIYALRGLRMTFAPIQVSCGRGIDEQVEPDVFELLAHRLCKVNLLPPKRGDFVFS
jgi:hypothetical protein